ncbi:PREDICTED: centrin-3-like [Papilio polytes]|uniref:centrin-3-like n=1 Tax=Papilio polytes TaxID=76194 RepID=UPI0006764FD2|nr:PREDICTED: centrin-3-like [Papilio polytes]
MKANDVIVDPLGDKTLRFSEQHLNEIVQWFEEKSQPISVPDTDEPLQFVNVDQLMQFLEERRFHKRGFYYPSFGEVILEAETFNAGISRVFTKEQILYMLDKWVIEANIKHELKLAFKVFDSENRTFLDIDEIRIIAKYGSEPFDEDETLELLRDANVRGDGNVYYEDFVESLFSLAPELYGIKAEYLFENPEEDPSQIESTDLENPAPVHTKKKKEK